MKHALLLSLLVGCSAATGDIEGLPVHVVPDASTDEGGAPDAAANDVAPDLSVDPPPDVEPIEDVEAPDTATTIDGAPPPDDAPPPDAPLADAPPSETSPVAELDEEGVKMLLPTNAAGCKWRLGTKDPNSDTELRIDGSGSAVKSGDAWTAKSRSGSLASGGTQLTLRIHVNVKASQGKQLTDHKVMAEKGYMVSPLDCRNMEVTGYFRPRNVKEADEALAIKLRGGSHTSDSPSSAACIGMLVQYDGNGTKLWEKELFHPTTPKFEVKKLASHGDVRNKWFGAKALVWNAPDGKTAISELWVDKDPFDASGKPKNNWVKIYRYVDASGTVVTWGGKFETWRLDQAEYVDFKMLSVREIVPPK